MCHHYLAAQSLAEDFGFEFSLSGASRAAVDRLTAELTNAGAWPLKTVPALRIDDSGDLVAFGAEWGLLPRWWKPSDKVPKRSTFQRKTINARSETAATKPAFRDAWKHRRCLLPVSEFMERDHYFGIGEPVAFAGLWESWIGEDGDVLTTTLLTTKPNAEVQHVGHHRMPVLLTTPEDRRDWLAGSADERLVVPLADGALAVRGK
ncbi:hypothetical protein MalM25_28630 [Planctomycetes bacterium MalM25]|nr:hypothetical protein MalM25_28630 [Planctomycetes bacterium MalM25]